MADNKTFIQQSFEFAKFIIDRSGMRSLIALTVDVALLYFIYLLIKGCDITSIILIYTLLTSLVVITISFFVIRHFERREK